MQQVKSKQRFWWRAAHDAPTPEPDAAQWVAPSQEARTATHGRGSSAATTVGRRAALRLQIPRGERRFRRSRRGRRWRWAMPSLVVIVVVAMGAVVSALPLEKLKALDISGRANDLVIAAGFGIDQVNLSGQHYTSDSDVFDALDLPNVKTFAAFDSDAALKRIERIAWVDSAQLTRVYPGTLDVVIRERAPAFIWTRAETNYLVDPTGRVLGPAAAGSGWNLPRVIGDGADREATLMLSALRLCPRIEQQYAYGERVAERRWRIVLKNGTALELAADREIEGLQEIATARAVQPALTGAAMIVDVRTPGRITMRPAASARTASLAGAETASLASAAR